MPVDVQVVKYAISASQARWEGADNPITQMSRTQLLRLLGYVPRPTHKPLHERENIAQANLSTLSHKRT